MKIIEQAKALQRRMRKPRQPFQIEAMPYQIAPFSFMPVYPNETLKNAYFQAKTVSDNLASDIMGAHLEHYWFYVPLTCLPDAEAFKSMVINPEYDVSALITAAPDPFTNFAGGGINYVEMCLKKVVETYFRSEDHEEEYMTGSIDGRASAKVVTDDYTQSLAAPSHYTGIDIDLDLDGDGTTTVSELERAREMYTRLMLNGAIEMTFEQFLSDYGIRQTVEEKNEPELLRYLRSYQDPIRGVDPTTGAPTARWTWKSQDSINKDRLFKHPGFIIGVQVCRPKVFLGNLEGTATSFIQSGNWLPAQSLNAIQHGLKEFAAGTGPIPSQTGGYVVDLRDLLRYGEQFVNFDLAQDGHNVVALPSADLSNLRYPSLADVQGLFASDLATKTKTDGLITYNIASHLGDDVTGATV